MSDLFFALGKHYFDHWSGWLRTALLQDDAFPSPNASREKKEAFAKQLLRERGHKRKLQDATRAFALACRQAPVPVANPALSQTSPS